MKAQDYTIYDCENRRIDCLINHRISGKINYYKLM